ncbi:MAG: hypothetical protein IPJ99_00435 [Betaproteobacteria bacterium]|nr:hypothetical protein [Betaproteobacteria bacterium]
MSAWDGSKKLVIDTLDAEIERLKKDDTNFGAKVKASGVVTLNAVAVEQRNVEGNSRPDDYGAASTTRTSKTCSTAPGSDSVRGLHLDFWQTHYDADVADDMPSRSRLTLFLVLQDEKTWKSLEKACGDRIHALLKANKAGIKKLTTAEQEEYNKVQEVAKDPEALAFLPPGEIMLAVDRSDPAYRPYAHHLYIDATGHFVAPLNSWEHAVVKAEVAREDVVGWLRNIERKPWALAMPYELGGEVRPMYPDFLRWCAAKAAGWWWIFSNRTRRRYPTVTRKPKGWRSSPRSTGNSLTHRADSPGGRRNQAAGLGRARQSRQGVGGG